METVNIRILLNMKYFDNKKPRQIKITVAFDIKTRN